MTVTPVGDCTKCWRPVVAVQQDGRTDLRHQDGKDHGHAVGIKLPKAVARRFEDGGRAVPGR